jgi:hypothetical protein
MSDEPKDHVYYHDLFQDNQQAYNQKPASNIAGSSAYNSEGFDHPSYISFTESLQAPMDYNSLASAFGLSPPSSEVFSSIESNPIYKPTEVGDLGGSGGGGGGSDIPVTPNSSISSSSTEIGGEEDSGKSKKDRLPKELEDGGESSKKV